MDASQITASWQTFGPTLDARDIHVGLKDGGTMAVKRVTLALDVWQSLLHMRWQFRDLTFWQLQVHTNTPIQTNDGGESLKTDRISDLFLRQFDHFTLRDSHLSFLTLSWRTTAESGQAAAAGLRLRRDARRHSAQRGADPPGSGGRQYFPAPAAVRDFTPVSAALSADPGQAHRSAGKPG